jgi:hypothetical protein
MLLVIAIIGILSGVIFVMVGDNSDAQRASVMSSAKSALGFAQVCKFKGWDLNMPSPADGSGSGDYLCTSGGGEDSLEEWAELTVDGCEYSGIVPGSWDYIVDCSGAANITGDDEIRCSASDGKCEWQ